MKKIGLVGGLGPESTIPYYHDIVYGVKEKVGMDVFPKLSIESVNVFDVLQLCSEQKYDELTDYLMVAINNLVKSGADFVALSANTPHIVFDKLQENVVPTADEMEFINQKIASELELGIVKEDTLRSFQKIIGRMKEDRGIEAIVLGCTELSLLLNDEVSPVPCLDTMKIHVKTLVDRIVE